MHRSTLSLVSLGLALASGAAAAPPVSYTQRVRPILERNCVACHACYDAPCQAKLGTPQGIERGASQQTVYAASRRKADPTTRLFFDAQTPAEWREKGFYSITDGGADSLMAKMLELGRTNTMAPNEPVPAKVKLGPLHEDICPTRDEFDDYAKKRPLEGMPLAMAPLADEEYETLNAWLAQGAPLDPPADPVRPFEAQQIRSWEAFLNQGGDREALVSRYLYEHLYLAHLYFEGGEEGRYFELVRSLTPPGSAIEVVATRRPNYDAGAPVFYRLRRIEGPLIHKTHITYSLSPQRQERYRQLFLDTDWEAGELPPYDLEPSVNPLETFAAIPAESRYRFMLDTAKFFVRTFIRGPVCRGQVATDVIDDHFWVLFQSPESDLFVQDGGYAARQIPNLRLAGTKMGSRFSVRPKWLQAEQAFAEAAKQAYARAGRPGWDTVWDGDGHNPDAMLTVFRHYDSATVEGGWVGDVPKTTWMIDYPIFERIYYLLVVNFDVFGNVTHQLNTRLYFDLLRAESENNFLRLLPAKVRQELHDYWYRGTFASLKRRMVYGNPESSQETTISFARGDDPQREFAEAALERMAPVAGPHDYLNRCAQKPCAGPGASAAQAKVEGALQELANLKGAQAPFIPLMPELTFVRIVDEDGGDRAYSLVHDRAHLSVAFMMREESRFEPEEDTIVLTEGPTGSYPNLIFVVPAAEVQGFVSSLLAVRDEKGLQRVKEAYGVRRTRSDFWDHFHFFTEALRQKDPREAGIYDANRYENF